MGVLILIYSALYFLIAWRRPFWALAILIIALPSYLIKFNLLAPLNLLDAMISILFFSWLIKNRIEIFSGIKEAFSKMPEKINYPYGIEMILLLFVAFFSASISLFSNASLGIFKSYFFLPIILYILVISILNKEKKEVRDLIWPLACSAFLVSLVAIYQKITGDLIANPSWQAESTRRVVSFFGYPNAVALFLGPIAIIIFAKISESFFNRINLKKFLINKKNIFLAITFIMSALSIYFARSAGGLAAMAVGIFAVLFFINKKTRILAIATAVICCAIVFSMPSTRLKAIDFITLADFSGQVRRIQWDETKNMLKDGRLFTGAGLTGYQAKLAPYHTAGFFVKNHDPEWLHKVWYDMEYNKKMWQPLEIYLYPHNIILNFWVELGLVGMLLFVWIISKFFYLAYRLRKDKNNKYIILGLVGAMITIIVHGLVDVPYFKNDLASIFWILLAMISYLYLQKYKLQKK